MSEDRAVKGLLVFIKVKDDLLSCSIIVLFVVVLVQGLVVVVRKLLKVLDDKVAFFGMDNTVECLTFSFSFLPVTTFFLLGN